MKDDIINEDCYSLDELIQRMEDIKDYKDGATFNLPKAIYTLTLELKVIKQRLEEES